jgi:hypothetical protein
LHELRRGKWGNEFNLSDCLIPVQWPCRPFFG